MLTKIIIAISATLLALLPTTVTALTVPPLTAPVTVELCNCYLYVKERVPELPLMVGIQPNASPSVGAVALFEYVTDGNVIPHYGIVVGIGEKGFTVMENNYKPCVTAKRFVAWGTQTFKGFWLPEN